MRRTHALSASLLVLLAGVTFAREAPRDSEVKASRPARDKKSFTQTRPQRRAVSLLQVEELKLTPEQRRQIEKLDRRFKAKMDEVRAWYLKEAEALLSQEQKALLKQIRFRRFRKEGDLKLLSQLDLTPQQLDKIRAILSRRDADLVQLAELQEELEQARQDLRVLEETAPLNREAIQAKRSQIRTLVAPLRQVDRRYQREIMAVLNEAQQAQYEKLKAEALRKRNAAKQKRPGRRR